MRQYKFCQLMQILLIRYAMACNFPGHYYNFYVIHAQSFIPSAKLQ